MLATFQLPDEITKLYQDFIHYLDGLPKLQETFSRLDKVYDTTTSLMEKMNLSGKPLVRLSMFGNKNQGFDIESGVGELSRLNDGNDIELEPIEKEAQPLLAQKYA